MGLRLGWWGDVNKADMVADNPNWSLANRTSKGTWPQFKGYYGAHAIVLTPEKAKKLVDAARKTPGDFADRFTQNTDELRSYVVGTPIVALEDSFGSTRFDGFDSAPPAVHTHVVVSSEKNHLDIMSTPDADAVASQDVNAANKA